MGLPGIPSILLALVLAAGADDGPVIDMVVAEADSTVITLSELMLESRLVLLVRAGPETARSAPLTDGLLRSVLLNIVNRSLLAGEARRLLLRVPPVEAALQSLTSRFDTPEGLRFFLEDNGFPAQIWPSPELLAILQEQSLQKHFIDRRVRDQEAVREEAVKACLSRNQHHLVGVAPRDARDRVMEVLRDERVESAIRALLRDLKSRKTVRYAPGFRPEVQKRPPATLGITCR